MVEIQTLCTLHLFGNNMAEFIMKLMCKKKKKRICPAGGADLAGQQTVESPRQGRTRRLYKAFFFFSGSWQSRIVT